MKKTIGTKKENLKDEMFTLHSIEKFGVYLPTKDDMNKEFGELYFLKRLDNSMITSCSRKY